MSAQQDAASVPVPGPVATNVKTIVIHQPCELPAWADLDVLVEFFHEQMKPYHDAPQDVRRGLEYAFDKQRGGFVVLASAEDSLVGALAMLDTHMGGYIPRNLLLFVAVLPPLRGCGIGRRLIETAAAACDGPIKLHVEPDNPARRLYERVGFATKYLEMRWVRP